MAGTARADILHSGGFPDTGFYRLVNSRLVNSLLIGFIRYILSFNCYEYVFFLRVYMSGESQKWFFSLRGHSFKIRGKPER